MHTVIAAFDQRQDAQRALERLIESGFSRDMVHLQARDDTLGERSGVSTDEPDGFFERIGRFFADLFGTDDAAGDPGRYAETVRRGGTVLIVDAADEQQADRAREIVAAGDGAVDIDERASQWSREGWTGFDARAASDMPRSADIGSTEGTQVMPVVQEELQVGKRAVSKGGVRVIQRVTETPVKEMIRLRDERATIERRPVDRPAGEADFANFKEGTIEVRETTEEPVVSKTARVVEEVVVGKEVQERTETVAETVRRTDVEVERLAGDTASAGGTAVDTGRSMRGDTTTGSGRSMSGVTGSAAGDVTGGTTTGSGDTMAGGTTTRDSDALSGSRDGAGESIRDQAEAIDRSR